MSHTVTVETQVKDIRILEQVCQELGFGFRQINADDAIKFYDGTSHTEGHAIDIPGWRYPVVVDSQGKMAFDNYSGRWGNESQLHVLRQKYTESVTIKTLKSRGAKFKRTQRDDGSIVLTVTA
jgi:hypothetical protein